MTPSEREAAKRALGQCVRSACAGAYAREVSSYLRRALDQIDADERLMEQAIESLVVGGDYQADAWNDAKKLCADHGWHRTDAEKIQVAIDALRTRLGQETDDE